MNREDYLCGGSYQKCLRGESLPQSKLTESQVLEIRKLHEAKQKMVAELNEKFSTKGLAKLFNVHHRTIEKVISYAGWKHV